MTRAAMLAHCRTQTMACNYTEGENMVCVLDFKREVGLWHSVLTSVLNGMHVVFIPYALMKVNPASWMQMITKYRGMCRVVQTPSILTQSYFRSCLSMAHNSRPISLTV